MLEVKKNKASGQKFINVPKDSSLEEGDSIEITRVITVAYRKAIDTILNKIEPETDLQKYFINYLGNTYKTDFFLDCVLDEYLEIASEEIKDAFKYDVVGYNMPIFRKHYPETPSDEEMEENYFEVWEPKMKELAKEMLGKRKTVLDDYNEFIRTLNQDYFLIDKVTWSNSGNDHYEFRPFKLLGVPNE